MTVTRSHSGLRSDRYCNLQVDHFCESGIFLLAALTAITGNNESRVKLLAR